jgi:LysM repeat protein
MAAPLIVYLAGQAFRLAGTQAVRNLIKKSGAKILKSVDDIPKKAGKPREIKGSTAFNKLIKERKPDLFEQVGNVFAKKSNKMTMASPGRASSKEGIVSGVKRVAGRDRGQQVRGGAKVLGGIGAVGAIASAVTKGSRARKDIRDKKKGSTLSKSSDISKRIPTTYTVKKGDTFTSIAREKGTTVAKLKELNKVDPKKLQIGSKVKLR